MHNRLWKDLTDRLAKEPFEGIYWGWGPQWVNFIKIDSLITVDKPLWTHKESSLDTIQFFDLSPEQLHREIIRYWHQPFWKRWFLSLFTSINSKIKLWSYYHRCLAVRKTCIENIYRTDKPIDSLFEQYLGEEIVQRLFQTTMKLTKYLEKHAGDFTFEENDQSVDFYLKGNSKFFDKLMVEKLDTLAIKDKNYLQKQLKREFGRHEMMLFSYLTEWEEQIFSEPIYFDEPILLDICVDPRNGKKVTYSTQFVEEWIKLKRQILESMLRNNDPEQFHKIQIFLESTRFKIKQLFNRQLERFEQLIVKVKCDELAADKAIQQGNILNKNLILFKKGALIFHPDKSYGNKDLQAIQVELFKDFSYLINDSIERIKQELMTLEKYLNTEKNKLAFYKMRTNVIFNIDELEKIKNDLHRRLDEIDGNTNNNNESQKFKEKRWHTDAEIVEVHSGNCNYNNFIEGLRAPLTSASLKSRFNPSNNSKQIESKKQEDDDVYETTRCCSSPQVRKSPLRRSKPVFQAFRF